MSYSPVLPTGDPAFDPVREYLGGVCHTPQGEGSRVDPAMVFGEAQVQTFEVFAACPRHNHNCAEVMRDVRLAG